MPTCSSVCLWQPTLLTCPICEKTIADLLQTEKEHAIVHYMNTQIQEGGKDFGLFAIATATTFIICNGQDPVDLEYQQSSMQSHLLKAFEMKTLLPFPSKATRKRQKRGILRRQRIAVYFSCRLPDDGRQMIQCWSLQPMVPRKLHWCTNDSLKW